MNQIMNKNSKSPKLDFNSTSVFGHPIRNKEFDVWLACTKWADGII